MKKLLVPLVVALLAGAGWWYFGARGVQAGAPGVQFRSAKVERGEIVEGVEASGTVQPVVLVQVGTQISGVIEKLFADFNSKVQAGQTIALLDSRRLQAAVSSDEAAVARAKADLERIKAVALQAHADVTHARAQAAQSRADQARAAALATQADRDHERQKELAERKLISPADLDASVANKAALAAQLAAAQAAVEQADAQVASSEAGVQQDEAQIAVGQAVVKQAEAQLASDKVNLDYATIVSPVDGTVVSRNVDVGQTVAASLQAPTLFLIAQDLTQVQVQVSVPEADIGKVRVGQPARFGVDAYSEKSFSGKVSQVRLASTTVQNVVTYTVVVDASNPEGLLFPGMTASLTFELGRSAPDALHVASSALRLQPTSDLLVAAPAGAEKIAEKIGEKGADPNSPEKGAHRAGAKGARKQREYVYVVGPDKRLRAIAVRSSFSDAFSTVIEPLDPGSLKEGDEVVTAIVREAEAATTNPFAPPRMGGGRTR